jgi:penicillin-binding protein 1A
MGLTPKLVTGVWVGAEDRVVRFRSTAMGQGARAALPIYGYFMQRAYRDKIFSTFEDFRQPPDYDPTMFECSETTVAPPTSEIEIPFEF